jgi:hypothetical protein
LVPAAQVEEHGESARKEGFEARLEKFEDSPHVARARTHPERYWGVVKNFWEDVLEDHRQDRSSWRCTRGSAIFSIAVGEGTEVLGGRQVDLLEPD